MIRVFNGNNHYRIQNRPSWNGCKDSKLKASFVNHPFNSSKPRRFIAVHPQFGADIWSQTCWRSIIDCFQKQLEVRKEVSAQRSAKFTNSGIFFFTLRKNHFPTLFLWPRTTPCKMLLWNDAMDSILRQFSSDIEMMSYARNAWNCVEADVQPMLELSLTYHRLQMLWQPICLQRHTRTPKTALAEFQRPPKESYSIWSQITAIIAMSNAQGEFLVANRINPPGYLQRMQRCRLKQNMQRIVSVLLDGLMQDFWPLLCW